MNKHKRMEEVVELKMEKGHSFLNKKENESRYDDIDDMFVCLFQGCIPLQGCQVNEHIANPDEPGRHLFEIVPGELSPNSSTFYLQTSKMLILAYINALL